MMRVRRTRAEEWERLRELRLRALADAPEAFLVTVAEAEGEDETRWRERARGATYVAEAQDLDSSNLDSPNLGAWLGSATTFEDAPGVWSIVDVWVAPEARRRGVARALVARCAEHARAGGGRVASLQVLESNAPARALYAALGFLEVAREAHPRRAGAWEIRMERAL